jgi:hypothetical protein
VALQKAVDATGDTLTHVRAQMRDEEVPNQTQQKLAHNDLKKNRRATARISG